MKKATFVNIVIIICVCISAAITAAVVYEYHRLDTVMPPGVVTALLGLWGGELLIIAIRQIFGSDIMGRNNKSGGKDNSSSI